MTVWKMAMDTTRRQSTISKVRPKVLYWFASRLHVATMAMIAGAGLLFMGTLTPQPTYFTTFDVAQLSTALPSWRLVATENPDNTAESLNGVSCVTTKFCMAVGSVGESFIGMPPYSEPYDQVYGPGSQVYSGTLIEVFGGTSWKVVRRPNPIEGGSLSSVSCTSVSFCAAVGNLDTGNGFSEIWNGSSWRLAAVPLEDSTLSGVSCTSPNFCADSHGDIWNGSSWRFTTSLANLFSVSCTSVSFCMAVGGDLGSFGPDGRSYAYEWNGSTWSAAKNIPQYNEETTTEILDAVSCTSANYCVAVGYTQRPTDAGPTWNGTYYRHGIFDTWNGSSWNLSVYFQMDLRYVGVSCPIQGFCMMVGVNGQDEEWDSTRALQTAIVDTGRLALSVSCLSTSFCVGVGTGGKYNVEYGSVFPGTTAAEVWNGSSRTAIATPEVTYGGFLTGVSCTASSFCMSVGYDSAMDSLAESWNGSSWKVVTVTQAGAGYWGYDGIACVNVSFCMEGNSDYMWNGSSWVSTPSSGPANSYAWTPSISCVSVKFCTEVGIDYQSPMSNPNGTSIYSWNGSTWAPVSSPSPTGPDDALNGVSCVKTNFCMAVGSELTGTATLIEAFNGSTWTVMPSPTPKGGGTLSSVSCAATNFCMATGSGTKDNPFMEYYDGYNWTIISSPTLIDGGTLSSISCPEISSCVAVGELNTGYDSVATLVEDFNGIKWSIVPSPNPIYGGDLTSVSCPSLSFCMATGTGDVVYSLGETGYAPTPVVPSVTSISPNAGSSSGGTVVTIKGSDLAATTAVDFGGTPALSFHAISEFELTAVAPTKLPGTVPVSVVTPYGTSTTTPGCANSFTYGDNPPSPSPGSYTPITPFRAADTRPNSGKPYAGKILSSCGTLDIQLTGIPGSNVPSGGVSAIVADITAVDPSASGYLSVYPASSVRPVVSNLNFNAHTTVAGLIEVPLSSSGEIAIYNGSGGSTNVVVDVEGYIGTTGDLYNPIDPLRICDTRPGNPSNLQGQESQCNSKTLSPNTPLSVQVAGIADIPLSAVAAVVNITVADSSGGGYVTVYPASSTPPVSSNVNFTKGELISNRAVVGLSPSGKIDIISNTSTDVIVDIAGYYSASGSSYNPLLPARIADSRCDTTSPPSYCPSENLPSTNMSFFALGPGSQENLTVAGIDSVPLSATAVVLNVTVTSTTRASYLTLWPSGTPRPVASDLNWQPGTTIANLVVADVGKNGQVSLYNNGGSTEVIVDIEGYYG